MANTLMRLMTYLGVDSSAYNKGIKAAESIAQSSSKNMTKSFAGISFNPTAIKEKFGQVKTVIGENIDLIDNLTQSTLGMSASSLMGAGSVLVVAQMYRESIDYVIEYAKQVRDLNRDIGGTPEEISKLIQAADDAEVSYESLKNSLVIANKQGVDVSIAGIEKLADRYNSIQDPLQRTKFLTDTFGRSGEQMGQLMAMGGEGIRAAGQDAVHYSQILDSEAIEKTEAWRIAVDGFNDALTGMKKNLALEAIPTLTATVNAITPVLNLYNQLHDSLKKLDPTLRTAIVSWYAWLDPIEASLAPLKLVLDLIEKIKAFFGGKSAASNTAATFVPSWSLNAGTKHSGYGEDYVHPTIYVPGFANGGSFTVPSNYSGDSFPMLVSANEKVRVTPAGKSTYEGPSAKEIGRETALALMQFGIGA